MNHPVPREKEDSGQNNEGWIGWKNNEWVCRVEAKDLEMMMTVLTKKQRIQRTDQTENKIPR